MYIFLFAVLFMFFIPLFFFGGGVRNVCVLFKSSWNKMAIYSPNPKAIKNEERDGIRHP